MPEKKDLPYNGSFSHFTAVYFSEVNENTGSTQRGGSLMLFSFVEFITVEKKNVATFSFTHHWSSMSTFGAVKTTAYRSVLTYEQFGRPFSK